MFEKLMKQLDEIEKGNTYINDLVSRIKILDIQIASVNVQNNMSDEEKEILFNKIEEMMQK